MINYKWTFPHIQTENIGNCKNVITWVNFVLTGTDGIKSGKSEGRCKLYDHDPSNFIEFENITNEIMNKWMNERSEVLINFHKNNVDSQINNEEEKNFVGKPHFAE